MFSVCCHPKILLPWQRDVTTSLFYHMQKNKGVGSLYISYAQTDAATQNIVGPTMLGCCVGLYSLDEDKLVFTSLEFILSP